MNLNPTIKIKSKIIDRILLILTAFFILSIPILILSSIPTDPPRSKARDARRDFDIRQIQILLTEYQDKNNVYPITLDQLGSISTELIDPKTKLPYEYTPTEENKNYKLCANYENEGYKCFTSASYIK